MVPAVARAIAEMHVSFPNSQVIVREDGEGGAYVTVVVVPLGPPYTQKSTWVGFRIVHQYPYADTYPHFVRGDLARVDGRSLGDGTSSSTWEGKPAIQISRRSNRLDATVQTAAIKLQKVLAWLSTRP
jgi:hypothetical protein